MIDLSTRRPHVAISLKAIGKNQTHIIPIALLRDIVDGKYPLQQLSHFEDLMRVLLKMVVFDEDDEVEVYRYDGPDEGA